MDASGLMARAHQSVCSTALPAWANLRRRIWSPISRPRIRLASSHSAEVEDVARARAYRTKAGASEFRIARGDIHRHTDISWDGNRDGSLNDSYRYALDAVAFDYLGVATIRRGNPFATTGG